MHPALPTVLIAAMVAPGSIVAAEQRSPAAEVDRLATVYYEARLEHLPELAYFLGLPVERHDRLHDNSLAGVAAWAAIEDRLVDEVAAIDRATLVGTPEWITHGVLLELLEAGIGQRVCRSELWNVNQMEGWQLYAPQLAEMQPVGTADLRQQALQRWSSFPAFIRTEIDNLKIGLEHGYSSPRSVVERVVEQLDGLLALPTGESPFLSPANRNDDEAFRLAMEVLVELKILPAIAEYRNYLGLEYLPKARAALGVSAHPDGKACYEASLRTSTTLRRSSKEVFDLGQRTVGEHRRRVEELGKKLYGTVGFEATIRRVEDDPEDRFTSKEEILALSRNLVARSEKEMASWFGTLPARPVVVEPYPEYQDGTGVSARYEPSRGEEPGTYRVTLFEPGEKRRGSAEITAVHEAYPGHHLQIAIAQDLPQVHELTRLALNSGYVEGWARYAEALAEEIGLYQSTTALISRRAWPARGMVVDPGLHVMGWTRKQAVEFLMESGRFSPDRAEQMVDRIAILPGQLTAYDSGALEIFALRRLAEERLGTRFDIKAFHDRILEHGAIPLSILRTHMEEWIESEVVAGKPR